MNLKIAKQIFQHHNLGEIKSINKIDVGFTNKVYQVDDNYIIKICNRESNEKNFEREVFFYSLFKNIIPVPVVLVYDKTKLVFEKTFMIYKKIEGDNLYSKWHLLNNNDRKSITGQICETLKKINVTTYGDFAKELELDVNINWHDKIIGQIHSSLIKVKERQIISPEFIKAIENFIDNNHTVLKEQKISLVYWDLHFDNVLVQDTKLSGILDFEKTELAPLDYTLNVIWKMTEHPQKYMSEAFEKYARKEDYVHLLDWFREFYPELFEVSNLEKRMDFYSIEADLRTLLDWPNSEEVKKMLAKPVGYF